MSSRASLIDYLTPLLAATEGLEDVRVIPTPRAVDKITKPILIVKTDSVEKNPAAPRLFLGNFTLAIVSPHTDMVRAEDQLDDILELLLPKLLTWNIVWDRATQVGYDDEHLAYDITIRSILS